MKVLNSNASREHDGRATKGESHNSALNIWISKICVWVLPVIPTVLPVIPRTTSPRSDGNVTVDVTMFSVGCGHKGVCAQCDKSMCLDLQNTVVLKCGAREHSECFMGACLRTSFTGRCAVCTKICRWDDCVERIATSACERVCRQAPDSPGGSIRYSDEPASEHESDLDDHHTTAAVCDEVVKALGSYATQARVVSDGNDDDEGHRGVFWAFAQFKPEATESSI